MWRFFFFNTLYQVDWVLMIFYACLYNRCLCFPHIAFVLKTLHKWFWGYESKCHILQNIYQNHRCLLCFITWLTLLKWWSSRRNLLSKFSISQLFLLVTNQNNCNVDICMQTLSFARNYIYKNKTPGNVRERSCHPESCR